MRPHPRPDACSRARTERRCPAVPGALREPSRIQWVKKRPGARSVESPALVQRWRTSSSPRRPRRRLGRLDLVRLAANGSFARGLAQPADLVVSVTTRCESASRPTWVTHPGGATCCPRSPRRQEAASFDPLSPPERSSPEVGRAGLSRIGRGSRRTGAPGLHVTPGLLVIPGLLVMPGLRPGRIHPFVRDRRAAPRPLTMRRGR